MTRWWPVLRDALANTLGLLRDWRQATTTTEQTTMSDPNPTGPGGCDAVVNIIGEHYWCDETAPHVGLAHISAAAQAVWFGVGEAGEAEAAWAASGAEEDGR